MNWNHIISLEQIIFPFCNVNTFTIVIPAITHLYIAPEKSGVIVLTIKCLKFLVIK